MANKKCIVLLLFAISLFNCNSLQRLSSQRETQTFTRDDYQIPFPEWKAKRRYILLANGDALDVRHIVEFAHRTLELTEQFEKQMKNGETNINVQLSSQIGRYNFYFYITTEVKVNVLARGIPIHTKFPDPSTVNLLRDIMRIHSSNTEKKQGEFPLCLVAASSSFHAEDMLSNHIGTEIALRSIAKKQPLVVSQKEILQQLTSANAAPIATSYSYDSVSKKSYTPKLNPPAKPIPGLIPKHNPQNLQKLPDKYLNYQIIETYHGKAEHKQKNWQKNTIPN
ncbi:MAG: hypothetical protein AAF518_02245 [Spirochaetota bacterium]